MKILITGVNGFAGRHLFEKLDSTGHEVYGIDLSGSFSQRIVKADITNTDEVLNVLNKIQPDFIFHLAAISRVDYLNISNIYKVNLSGSINIFSASIKLQTMPKILFVSTSQVYGRGGDTAAPIDENCSVKPVNHYGAGKAAVENIARAFMIENNLEIAVARPFNHTGAGQDKHFVVPKIVDACRENREIELGDINTIRDFSDVRDVVDAYIAIMNNFKSGEIYNIAGAAGYKIKDIIKMLDDITGNPIRFNINSSFIRENEIQVVIGSFDKLHQATGWRPRYSLDETLRWMLEKQ